MNLGRRTSHIREGRFSQNDFAKDVHLSFASIKGESAIFLLKYKDVEHNFISNVLMLFWSGELVEMIVVESAGR